MKVACYCRVSTDKDAQLDSLDNQITFFTELCNDKNHDLYKIYADEGISGKQLKNRKEFQAMMRDARKQKFDAIMVKDISRFARNTVDFLVSIRELKAIGVNVYFVNYGMDIQEANEAYLTILAALAQDESATLSKRVKMGKSMSAKKGRVPNFVFGYDRIDKYTLQPNPEESQIVNEIFDMYTRQGMGTTQIAGALNQRSIVTKKNKQQWSQTVVGQILKNEIYIGNIINRKQEVQDFITGKRREIPRDEQCIVHNPELQIVPTETFAMAREIMEKRNKEYKMNNKRRSTKYPLSNLLKCADCGYSFRRCRRKYSHSGQVYEYWVCSHRNAYGADSCPNDVRIDEKEIHGEILRIFGHIAQDKKRVMVTMLEEIQHLIDNRTEIKGKGAEEIEDEIKGLKKKKEKYMEMYAAEVITMEELKKHSKKMDKQLQRLQLQYHSLLQSGDIYTLARKKIEEAFEKVDETLEKGLNNVILKQIFSHIVVRRDEGIEVYIRQNPQFPELLQGPVMLSEAAVPN